MITLVYKVDNTYGGKEYIEWNNEKKVYKTGQTRAHKGHYEGIKIEVEVKTLKELNNIEEQLISQGFTDETRTF